MNIKGQEDYKKDISLIIPLYNEISNIYSLMDRLEDFRNRCEIIFVDGGSIDGTAGAVGKRYRLHISPKKGRANQMNYGARLSSGDILVFLHADSIILPEAIDEAGSIIKRGYKAGCFRLEFESSSILMKICACMSSLRVVFRNIAFGDQGIFIERDYFNRLGSFRDIPLMEDYQLSIDIKDDGEKIKLAKSKIITSERRFKENGRISTMIRMQKLQHMYRKGEDIEEIANLYK